MSVPHSDAFVFFGGTGDLAYKKIFPSLQALIKHGNLNVPVIGVAKTGWRQNPRHPRCVNSRPFFCKTRCRGRSHEHSLYGG